VPTAGQHNVDASCIIVAICGSDTLARCIERIRELRPPPREILVCAADAFEIPRDIEEAGDLKIVRVRDDSPVALAAAGLAAATGDVIMLTEDHCLPVSGWIRELSSALGDSPRIAAGGPIDPGKDGTSFDWAFFIVDFFRYVPPVTGGPAESLSVCNVAYRRATLEEIRSEWSPGFHETRVHELLKARGQLWMVPGATVTSLRRVGTKDGVRERFTFGWLFAAKRFRSGDSTRRIAFAVGSLILPFVLFGRITRRCFAEPALAKRLIMCSPYVMLLVLAWSLGELVGYITGKAPSSSPAAKNRSGVSGSQAVNA